MRRNWRGAKTGWGKVVGRFARAPYARSDNFRGWYRMIAVSIYGPFAAARTAFCVLLSPGTHRTYYFCDNGRYHLCPIDFLRDGWCSRIARTW